METNIFSIANIDLVRKKKIAIKLEDETGTEVNVSEVITQVNSYITDQLTSKDRNVCLDQIFPLLSQLLNRSINSITKDIYLSGILMSQAIYRNTFISEMMLTFYFLKFIQKHNIKIVTMEEDISQEEIDKLIKADQVNAFSIAAINMGMPLKEVVESLLASGHVSRQDLIDSGMIKDEDILENLANTKGTN